MGAVECPRARASAGTRSRGRVSFKLLENLLLNNIRLSQQAAIEVIGVGPPHTDLRALGMPMVEENIPGCGHQDGGDSKKSATARIQPLVAGASCGGFVVTPIDA